jgi:hypothetical protein
MIRFEPLPDRNVLVASPDGPLEKADFERFSNELDAFNRSGRKLAGLMIEARSFPGWSDLAALTAHLKFVLEHHRQIDRIAVVTRSPLLKIAPHIGGLVVHPQIRHFESEERDSALAWLEEGHRSFE